MTEHRYSDAERAALYRAIYERRDMRHFLPDPVEPELLRRLLDAAHHAPSVGFMQPWRFIQITAHDLRARLHALVEQERRRTAKALHEREDEFMKLKVEGILDCAVLMVAALCDRREKAVFGRRTLPEMDLASLACAIQNLWLAARAEGLGMGWVSLFEPEDVKQLLAMPEDSHPVAILCLGHVERFYDKPMLEEAHWAQRMPLDDLLFENRWNGRAANV
ncbi:5,6-dimethylbenzimidazole synthase [Methylomicrobium lacus]|uniref:5,6-dimethylbenzimidazole synthase n=1 Tax=Methylomicrobium lacus TaxID=136992 RepID=UPI0035A9A942